jgi:hypothetical protein
MEASESNRTTHTSPLEDQGISMQDIPYSSIVERLAHTNPVGQLPGPLSYKLLDQFTMPMQHAGRPPAYPRKAYKLLDQFTMPMLPTEPQCTNVIACIRYSNNMPVVTV